MSKSELDIIILRNVATASLKRTGLFLNIYFSAMIELTGPTK